MKRKGKKGSISTILALMLLMCTIFNSSSFVLAAEETAPDQEVPVWQTMGIKEVLEYSQDKSSALVGVDLTEVDTEHYQIQQVQAADGFVLELDHPVITAAANDTYDFEITYVDLKDKAEKKQSTKLSVEVKDIETGTVESGDSDKQQSTEAQTEEKQAEETTTEETEAEDTKNELRTGSVAEVPATYSDESVQTKSGEESYFNGIRYAYVKNTEDPFINTEKSRLGDYTKRIYWNVEGVPDKVTLEIFDDSQLIVGPVDVTGQEYYEIRSELLKGGGPPSSSASWQKVFRELSLNGVRATYRLTAEKGNYTQVFRGAFGYSEIAGTVSAYASYVDSSGVEQSEPNPIFTLAPAVVIKSLTKNDNILNINWNTGDIIMGSMPSGIRQTFWYTSSNQNSFLSASFAPDLAYNGNVTSGVYVYKNGGVAEDQMPIANPYDNSYIYQSRPAWSSVSSQWTRIDERNFKHGQPQPMENSVSLSQGYNTIDLGSHAGVYSSRERVHTINSAYFDHIRLTYYEGDYYTLSYNANYPQKATTTSGTAPEDYTLYEQAKEPVTAEAGDLAASNTDGTTYEMVGWSRTAQEVSENPTPEFKVGETYHTQNTSGGITKNGTLYAVWKMTPPSINEVTVKKTVIGDTERTDFEFNVKFTKEDQNAYTEPIACTIGDEAQTITSGEGTVTLKNGEMFKMEIPENVYYQVTEKNYASEGAKTTVSVAGGEKTETLTSERRKSAVEAIDYTNTYPEKYDFTIQELITGAGADMKRDFTVKASFFDKDGKEVTGFAYAGTQGAVDSEGSASGTTAAGGVTLSMPHDSAMVFKNIPEGTDCQIVLNDGTDSYTYYVDGTIENDGTVTGGIVAENDGSYKVTIGKNKTEVQTIHYKGSVVPTGRNDTKFPVFPVAAGGSMMLLVLCNLLLRRTLQIGTKV